jgi:hypothetical protein
MTNGTKFAVWMNAGITAIAGMLNDTSVLQSLGHNAGYAVAGVAFLNALAHAFTGNEAPKK